MHGLQTLKQINDTVADNRARKALRDIVTLRKEAIEDRKKRPAKKGY